MQGGGRGFFRRGGRRIGAVTGGRKWPPALADELGLLLGEVDGDAGPEAAAPTQEPLPSGGACKSE